MSDYHRRFAATLFGVLPEDVTPEQIRDSKAASFASLHGGTDFRPGDKVLFTTLDGYGRLRSADDTSYPSEPATVLEVDPLRLTPVRIRLDRDLSQAPNFWVASGQLRKV